MSDNPIAFNLPRARQAFHRSPGVLQRDAVIVDDVPVSVPWILIIPRLEGKGSMDQVEIDVIHLELGTARFECGFDPLRTVIRVPQFRRDEQVFAGERPASDALPYRFAYLFFIAISFGAVEMAESDLERHLGSASCLGRIGNQRAKS